MTTAVCPACSTSSLAVSQAEEARANVFLSLPEIHCAGCIGKVERALNDLDGVRHARVNLSLKRVAIASDLPVATLVETLAGAGYEAHPLDAEILDKGQDAQGRALLFRLGLSGFAMMNVMLLSVSVWSGAEAATRDMFHLISAAIALPVVLIAGQPFFRNAWSALKVRTLNMDVPISLAILLAAGMSLFETLQGGEHAYFDAALALTFFLLIGRYLDHRSRAAARSAASELSALEVRTATRMRGNATEVVDVAELAIDDVILIPTGVRVPADGILLSAEGRTDRSFLTGESEAVHLASGAAVQAGEVNLGQPFRMRATAVGEDTTLRRVAALVETAENARNRYTALADRAARIYAPTVHLLALAAFLAWIAATGDIRHAINIAIAVLIITCPCALGLAVPAVSTAAIGKLYDLGFLVKSGTALERLAEVDTIVFDKTGTLTQPGFDLTVSGLDHEARAVARALAQASSHPASRALAEALSATAPAEVDEIDEVPGHGVAGLWNGNVVRLGHGAWIGAAFHGLGLRIGDSCTEIVQSERLRPGAPEAIAELKSMGYDVILMSGDRTAAVEEVAARLSIPKLHAGVSAEEKHAILTRLADDGHRVAMVGDGLNDAASLAAAHASIAPSSALDATRNAADIVVLRDTFADIPRTFRTARAATHLSRQNFAIATVYNMVAVPIALAGFATPLIAALSMSSSSITVLLNALRVRWVK